MKLFCLKCTITQKEVYLVPTLLLLRLVSLLQALLQLVDESEDELVDAIFRSGKWKGHSGASQCACVMFQRGLYRS